jgi:hypothetical protein
MSLARDRDEVGRNQFGRSQELRPDVAGSIHRLHANRLAFAYLLGEVTECMLNPLALDESRTLVAFFDDR